MVPALKFHFCYYYQLDILYDDILMQMNYQKISICDAFSLTCPTLSLYFYSNVCIRTAIASKRGYFGHFRTEPLRPLSDFTGTA